MTKLKSETHTTKFGIPAIFKLYTIRDFLKDAVYPAIFSLIILFISYIVGKDTLIPLTLTLTTLSVAIIPNILSILLILYIIFALLCWYVVKTKIPLLNDIIPLLKSINGSIAFLLLFLITMLGFVILIKAISIIGLSIIWYKIIVYLILFLLLLFLFLLLKLLKDVVVDIFNLGHLAVKLR